MRGIFPAIRALEDLRVVPPIDLPLHGRIVRGGGGGGMPKPRTTPHRFMWGAAKTSSQKLVAALAILSWVCFLRVGETATIRPCEAGPSSRDGTEGRWPGIRVRGRRGSMTMPSPTACCGTPLLSRAGTVPLRGPWQTCSRGPWPESDNEDGQLCNCIAMW